MVLHERHRSFFRSFLRYIIIGFLMSVTNDLNVFFQEYYYTTYILY